MSQSPSRRDAVDYGRIVHAFIKAGWNPPKPSAKIVGRIAEDMAAVNHWEDSAKWNTPTITLAASEKRALLLLADGQSVRGSARLVGISYESMKEQRKKLYEKLGARNGAHAVALGFRSGLLS